VARIIPLRQTELVQRFAQGKYPAYPRRPVSPTGVSYQPGGIPISSISPYKHYFLRACAQAIRRLYTHILYIGYEELSREKNIISPHFSLFEGTKKELFFR
jgi:hypothetical protein